MTHRTRVEAVSGPSGPARFFAWCLEPSCDWEAPALHENVLDARFDAVVHELLADMAQDMASPVAPAEPPQRVRSCSHDPSNGRPPGGGRCQVEPTGTARTFFRRLMARLGRHEGWRSARGVRGEW